MLQTLLTVLVCLLAAITWTGCDDDDKPVVTSTAPAGSDVVPEAAGELVESTGDTSIPADDLYIDTISYGAQDGEGKAVTVQRLVPKSASAGRSFTYEIHLQNSGFEHIEGLKVVEAVPAGFTVEQTTPPATPAQQSPDNSKMLQWTVNVPASDTVVLKVTGKTRQAGAMNHNLTLSGLTGTAELPSSASIAQPELLITREAPAKVELCDPITLKYTVTNNGDGDTGVLKLTETLPAGLATTEGGASVSFELGSLAKGETKEFVVELKATKPGEFSGAATATGSFGEMSSPPGTTVVVAPKLVLEVKSTAWEEVGAPVRYEVTVRNEGDAAAREVAVKFDVAGVQGAQLVTGPDMDTPAPPDASTQAIGVVEPKAERIVTFTLRPPTKGQLTANVTATAQCGTQASGQAPRPDAPPAQPAPQPAPVPEGYHATAQAQTSIIGVPASSMELADQAGPVAPGGEITYVVTVQNYGSANDRDANLTVTLPAGMTVGENAVQGPSQPKVEGQTLTFPPLPVLAPNQPQQWTIKATAPQQPGEAEARAALRTATEIAPIIRTESTRILAPTTAPAQ